MLRRALIATWRVLGGHTPKGRTPKESTGVTLLRMTGHLPRNHLQLSLEYS
jgi:hypothetical protein